MVMRFESSTAASLAAGAAVAAAFALLLAAPPVSPASLTASAYAARESTDSLMLLQMKAELQVKPDSPAGPVARLSEALAKLWPQADATQATKQEETGSSEQVLSALETPHVKTHGDNLSHGGDLKEVPGELLARQRKQQKQQQHQQHAESHKMGHKGGQGKGAGKAGADKKEVPPKKETSEGDVVDVRLSSELNQEAAHEEPTAGAENVKVEAAKGDVKEASKPAVSQGEGAKEAKEAPVKAQATPAKEEAKQVKEALTLTEDERRAIELPAVKEVTHGSQDAFELIKSQISSLSSGLEKEKTAEQKQLANHHLAYEQNLTEQRKVIKNLTDAKAAVARDVVALETKNTKLRENAAELKEANGLLEARLGELEQSVSLASEFVKDALTGGAAGSAGSDAEEDNTTNPLAVLRELAHEEAIVASESAERQALDSVANMEPSADIKNEVKVVERETVVEHTGGKKQKRRHGGRDSVSLLSASAPSEATVKVEPAGASEPFESLDGDDVDEAPKASAKLGHDAIHLLEDGLEGVRAGSASAEAALEQAFLADYASGDAKRLNVTGQLEELSAKRDSLQALEQRLEKAVESLGSEKRRLTESTAAAAAFLAKMGGRPVPLAAAKAI